MMMISIGDVQSINTVPNNPDWATRALRVRPPRPSMRGSSNASRSRRFSSGSSSRSSGSMQAPQEMPTKRKCESPGPDSSVTPTFFLAPRPEACTRPKTAAYSSEAFPDSPLAARMFDSWQYLSDDEEEVIMIDRCSAPRLVLDPADSMEFAPALPSAVVEPIDWTHSMMGVVDALVMDDDDDDNTSSVVSWDFWPRRTSLLSRDGSDFDDDNVEDGDDDDGHHGRDLLNVDRFMSSLLLSDDSDNEDVDDDDNEEQFAIGEGRLCLR
jgi:hypothetical protein